MFRIGGRLMYAHELDKAFFELGNRYDVRLAQNTRKGKWIADYLVKSTLVAIGSGNVMMFKVIGNNIYFTVMPSEVLVKQWAMVGLGIPRMFECSNVRGVEICRVPRDAIEYMDELSEGVKYYEGEWS